MSGGGDLLVGLIALALLPLIGWRILRGFGQGRLPIYRTSLTREDSGSKFAVLMALHVLSLIVVGLVAADLLFGLGLRERL
jgi:predicted small integral membrane protein